MHRTQQKILEIASVQNIASLKLRDLGKLIGEPHPQKVKHHLNQLFKKGFLKENTDRSNISRVNDDNPTDQFIFLPILGSANCGQATLIADAFPEGYLQVSKSMVPNYKKGQYFVLKAIGNSMNNATINNKHIDDGDYVVINKSIASDYQNKYVLSIINGLANIKKFIKDVINDQIILISESTQEYPPIYIHNTDFQDYMINGIVENVIKKPSI